MKLFVASLPADFDETDFREMFELYGEITSAKLVTDRATGKSKGFGFIEMPDKMEALSTIEALNGAKIKGKKLSVMEADDTRKGPGGPGGGGGFNRDRGGYGGGGDRGGYGGGGGYNRDRGGDRGGYGGGGDRGGGYNRDRGGDRGGYGGGGDRGGYGGGGDRGGYNNDRGNDRGGYGGGGDRGGYGGDRDRNNDERPPRNRY